MISGVEHIERGYDNVMNQFRGLGAKLIIHDIEDESLEIENFVGQVAVK